MRQTPATPAGSISIAEKVRVAVDWKAEPTDWDHAVARFLLAIVHKKSLPAAVAPLAETSGDIHHVAAGSPLLASPTG
jgi:hypothetical protein